MTYYHRKAHEMITIPYALSELRAKTVCIHGRNELVIHLTDTEFRHWLYSIMDSLEPRTPSTELRILRRECEREKMDESMRWYAVNELVRSHRFRQKKMKLFVEETSSLKQPYNQNLSEQTWQ